MFLDYLALTIILIVLVALFYPRAGPAPQNDPAHQELGELRLRLRLPRRPLIADV
jgi:hypothetical protein